MRALTPEQDSCIGTARHAQGHSCVLIAETWHYGPLYEGSVANHPESTAVFFVLWRPSHQGALPKKLDNYYPDVL